MVRVGFGKARQVAFANTLIYLDGQVLKLIILFSLSIKCIYLDVLLFLLILIINF